MAKGGRCGLVVKPCKRRPLLHGFGIMRFNIRFHRRYPMYAGLVQDKSDVVVQSSSIGVIRKLGWKVSPEMSLHHLAGIQNNEVRLKIALVTLLSETLI
ncbi:hypothetical protein AVEN_271502-1 [Araneus ventricosus]|uniref:Uncharacterized protein n=1 Tax=Araneus ventricosus TaxID=182803 RepID=A0A4Y2IDY4_ARAVE|nr:hypothetical protein AVEN_271502-1 [Araneus ventricosus]